MKLTDAIIGLGRPITFYPAIARIIGIKPCLLFCQLCYWTGKQKDPDGWIYKTVEEIEEETCLTYEEQRTARDVLKKYRLISEDYRRLQHQMFFKVESDTLDIIMAPPSEAEISAYESVREQMEATDTNTVMGNGETPQAEVDKNHVGEVEKLHVGNVHRVPESTFHVLSDSFSGGEKSACDSEKKLPAAKTKPSPNPNHKHFIDWWSRAFENKFGAPYDFLSAQDGANVKHLLSINGMTLDKLKSIAGNCWNGLGGFHCKNMASIQYLRSHINEIRAEQAAQPSWNYRQGSVI